MLEQSKDHAKFSTATWATNSLVSLENPPFLYKSKRITKEESRSWFRQTEGHGFPCMLSMPKDMVTSENPRGLTGRGDKLMEKKPMNREKLLTDNETPAAGIWGSVCGECYLAQNLIHIEIDPSAKQTVICQGLERLCWYRLSPSPWLAQVLTKCTRTPMEVG